MAEGNSFTLIFTRESDCSSMIVTREPDGLLTIQDYSHQDERKELLELAREMGLEVEVLSESLMSFHEIPGHKEKIFGQLSNGPLSPAERGKRVEEQGGGSNR